MNDTNAEEPSVELEVELDAPPHKVWRAISVPGLRENWLPSKDLADPEPTVAAPGEEVRYRMRDSAPPFLESTVTLRIAPNATGGTRLRIIHELARTEGARAIAANDNRRPMALAA